MPNVVVSDSNKPLWPSPRDGHACFTLAEDSSPLPQQSALRRSNSSVNISTEQAATTTTVESLPNLNTSATATASAAATASSSSAVSSSYSPPLTSTGPQILVMWGGDCNGIKSDIKLFSMNTKTWRDLPWHLDPIYKDSPQLSLQKCGPKKYFGSCMLYQQGMNRIFLFSGQDVGPPTLSGKCQLNNELWELDTRSGKITSTRPANEAQTTRANNPQRRILPRQSFTLIPSASKSTLQDSIVLFGGETSFSAKSGLVFSKRHDDVAVFNTRSKSWKTSLAPTPTDLLTITGAPAPSARDGHSAVYSWSPKKNTNLNTGKKKMIIYGGTEWISGTQRLRRCSDMIYLDLDKDIWIRPEVRGDDIPKGRAFHSAVMYGSKMIVYGGLVHKNSNSYNNGQDEDKENGSLSILVNTDDIKRAIDVERNDTVVSNEIYIYDTADLTWEKIKDEGFPARYGHSATMVGNQMLIFGGADLEFDNSPDSTSTSPAISIIHKNDFWYYEVGAPLPVINIRIRENDNGCRFRCVWEDPFSCLFDRGYRVLVQHTPNSSSNNNNGWFLVYEGTELSCMVERLDPSTPILPKNSYMVKVVAFNSSSASSSSSDSTTASSEIDSSYWTNMKLPDNLSGFPAMSGQKIAECSTYCKTHQKTLPNLQKVTVEGVEDSANNDTQDCERFLLSFTGLTEKQWGSQSQNRSYFVQANCAFVPDVFTSTTSTTLNSSSSSGFEFEPAAKKRRVSSKAAANDAFINYDPASWIELGSIIHECQTEATTPSFSKEYTIADLQRNVAQEIFNLRLFHYLQQQQKYLSARRAHDRDDQVQEWPPASKLYFKFRVKAMDEDGTSDFVFADSEIDDDSLLKAAEVAAANKEEEEKREKIDTAIEDAMPDEQKSPLLAEGEACAESDDIVMGDAHDAASAEAAAVNDNVIVPYSPSSQGATDTVMEMDSASVVVEPPPPTTTATSLSTMAVAVSSIDSPNLVEEKEASVVEVGANISEALTANTAPLRVAPHHKSKKPRGSLRASPKKSLSTPTQKRWPNSASFSDENSDLSNHEDDEYDNEIPVASPVVTAAVAPKASTSSTTNTTTTIASSTSANTHDPRVIFANEWFLKLGFGDVFEIKSDGEFYGAKAINYIYYKRINRIYLHFWYLNFNEKDQGRDWTEMTMPSDELVNAGDSALEAQKIFLAELDVRPYDKKNKAQSGKAKNTAYFKPESKGCVLPDRFGKAEKGKIYIFESDLDPPSLEDTPEEWLSKVL